MTKTVFDADEVCLVMNESDNIAIARRTLPEGSSVRFGGAEVVLPAEVPVGHKLARRDIAAGEKVMRWGLPIGSATVEIPQGHHVHLHNLKSDYIPTFKAGEFVTDEKEAH